MNVGGRIPEKSVNMIGKEPCMHVTTYREDHECVQRAYVNAYIHIHIHVYIHNEFTLSQHVFVYTSPLYIDIFAGIHVFLGSSRDEDRANQYEIGELSEGTVPLYWETSSSLHYHDLGPDGKPTKLRDSLVFVKRAQKAGKAQTGQTNVKKGAGSVRKAGKKALGNPLCKFCGGASGGDKAGAVNGHPVMRLLVLYRVPI